MLFWSLDPDPDLKVLLLLVSLLLISFPRSRHPELCDAAKDPPINVLLLRPIMRSQVQSAYTGSQEPGNIVDLGLILPHSFVLCG